jgi:hypothetical protein
VTLGNFEAPIQISIFVKDLFAGFSMVSFKCITGISLNEFDGVQLNLKNDTLRRRFDSLKYDLKKIEEGGLTLRTGYMPVFDYLLFSGIRRLAPEIGTSPTRRTSNLKYQIKLYCNSAQQCCIHNINIGYSSRKCTSR